MEFALKVFVICPAVSPSRHHSHSPTCMDRGNTYGVTEVYEGCSMGMG